MICIIGGSGFIGSRLCNRLKEEETQFKILDKTLSPFFPENTVIMDIRNPDSYRKELEGADVVINLAAEHRDDVTPKSLYDEVNVIGAEKLVKICEYQGIKNIIFTSSVAVYGFAPKGTDETGKINYFNDYGRTKWAAEKVYRGWQQKVPDKRSLTIIRPTVVFGERNRGNVYNLLKQIATGFFPMIGNGKNIKSMAYVENVAAFIQSNTGNIPGLHLFNYIDKPDFDMNRLVVEVKKALGKAPATGVHWPVFIGYIGGVFFDIVSFILRKKLSISSIRIKKFFSDTMFDSVNIKKTEFKPPISINEGIKRTLQFEFIEKNQKDDILFYSE